MDAVHGRVLRTQTPYRTQVVLSRARTIEALRRARCHAGLDVVVPLHTLPPLQAIRTQLKTSHAHSLASKRCPRYLVANFLREHGLCSRPIHGRGLAQSGYRSSRVCARAGAASGDGCIHKRRHHRLPLGIEQSETGRLSITGHGRADEVPRKRERG